MARKARTAAQDKNLRSASTSMPGPKQPSRSAASGCSASVYRPIAAPSRLPVPDSAAATHRACGNAPSRDWLEGRPKNAAFFGLSGTSVTDPSMETTRSPQQNTPGAPSAPVGPATCSNNIRTGSAPSLPRPRDSEEMFGSHHWRAAPRIHPPSRRQAPGQQVRPPPLAIQAVGQLGHHLPVPAVRSRNSHNASAKYTISRAGNNRRRCSRVPVTSMTSSTSSGGTPWSPPSPRSGPAASHPARAPQNHHEPQNGHDIPSDSKARPLTRRPASGGHPDSWP